MNSSISENQIDQGRMNLRQCKDTFFLIGLPGLVLSSWSLKQKTTGPNPLTVIGIFTNLTKFVIIPMLASEALQRENKKKTVTKCYPSRE